jgi:hypothetical protein
MKGQPLYRVFNKVSALAMILALLWLTISAPFVNAAAQAQACLDNDTHSSIPANSNDEEAATPLGNATEEKAGNSTNLSEEYLHGHDKGEHFFSIASLQHKCEHADTYNAFHGELLVPPPNRA